MSLTKLRVFGLRLRRHWRRILLISGVLSAAFGLWFWQALPEPLFPQPYSLEVRDADERLLGARIAADGQWRFPLSEQVPERYQQALLTFEDKRFMQHPGVDPLALARAVVSNLKARRVVSGASTISMQTIRLARNNPARTIPEKLHEMLLALRLELRYSKAEILKLYVSHAPFGGNVIGLEAASWRYFGRAPERLSWSEAALLAVLPNAPSLMHPGRNREPLLAKRNRLLETLHQQGLLSDVDLQLAKAEPLPAAPLALPDAAPHLVDRFALEHSHGARVRTTVKTDVQQRGNAILRRYQQQNQQNGIDNLAALIIDNTDGAVLGYYGNTRDANADGHAVDVITAPRSTGSLLKPVVHAMALEQGVILPRSILADIPVRYQGFSPKNFDTKYRGVVRADVALATSLNVTAARLQQRVGTAALLDRLRKAGLNTLTEDPDHYGLTLVLGGAEARLWDLANMYASMARSLAYPEASQFVQPAYLQADFATERRQMAWPLFDRAALWYTVQAMTQLERPESHGAWRSFVSKRKVAWKTGTSQGFRDAWAIGITPDYTVAVWVGNASGEGRAGLTGIQAAAPIMFELFELLPREQSWFPKPHQSMRSMDVCAQSGYLASRHCPEAKQADLPQAASKSKTCPFHKILFLNETGNAQVSESCVPPPAMRKQAWFVLPPNWAWYYQKAGWQYHAPPGYLPGCEPQLSGVEQPLSILNPRDKSQLYIPVNLDGSKGEVVFEVAHLRPETKVHWHLNEAYLGYTEHFHSMSVQPKAGVHQLTVVDESGHTEQRQFQIVE